MASFDTFAIDKQIGDQLLELYILVDVPYSFSVPSRTL